MHDEIKRKYYSIGDVAKMTGLKPHILRYWETEFPLLRPRKNRAGNRAYTERDITIVRLIKKLLYKEKFTIGGARQRMKSDREFVNEQLALPFSSEPAEPTLESIRRELMCIMELVKSL